jgi:phosphomannomutase
MPIISSISGLRALSKELEPDLLLNYTLKYISSLPKKRASIVLGRDGRLSSETIYDFIKSALLLFGQNVYSVDLVATPTLAQYIKRHKLDGGIMITASHNPEIYNGLKFFNKLGQYIDYDIKSVKEKKIKGGLGKLQNIKTANFEHIKDILKLNLVTKELIKKRNFKIVVDVINSSGVLVISELFKSLGISNYVLINNKLDLPFAHNPEPLAKNLKQLCKAVKENKADLGFAVDPDVDRLVMVDENAQVVIEENTLILVAQYVLKNYNYNNKYKKAAVSNLSSSKALADICQEMSADYYFSKVGELNVVAKMKETRAVIGGEGNGGIIYPQLHYGRDALVGIALLLSYLAESKKSLSELVLALPQYYFVKEKIKLDKKISFNKIKQKMKSYNSKNEQDGLRLNWPDAWLHIRKSNTEPIIRIYGEAKEKKEILNKIKELKSII